MGVLSVLASPDFCDVQVIVVPLIDGILGSKIPIYTWFGALASIIGVAMLESSGSPPCVSVYHTDDYHDRLFFSMALD